MVGIVSILVVLDWTMMRDMAGRLIHRLSCFNPCCIGLDNDAIAGIGQRIFGTDVSILVVLDWTMMHWPQRQAGHLPRVSILVVLDWTMMRAEAGRSELPTWGFNPCCIGLDNDALGRLRQVRRIVGFNPCCIGLDNDARGLLSSSAFSASFQSLLYWIGQ